MYGIIYCTTNLVNGRKYIGQHKCDSKDFDGYLGSGTGIFRAIRKYGKENFIRETLCEAQDVEDLNDLEKYYIDYFGANKSRLFYNIQDGGGSNYRLYKSVACYDLQGRFIKKYNSITDCAKDINVTASRVSGMLNGRYFRVKDYQIIECENCPDSINSYGKNIKVPVAMYDLSGNFVKKFNSITACSNELKADRSFITKCISGEWKYFRNCQFRKIENNNIVNKIPSISKSNKEIEISVYNLDGKFLYNHTGARSLSKKLGINCSSVFGCINGLQKRAGNFQIRRKENPTVKEIEPYSKTAHSSKRKPVNVYKNGKLISNYDGVRVASRELNFDSRQISSVLKGVKSDINGYTFKYVNSETNTVITGS